MTGGDPYAELAVRLRDAHRRIASLDAPAEVRQRIARRLIALADTAKRDASTASARLDALLDDLDAGRVPEARRGAGEA